MPCSADDCDALIALFLGCSSHLTHVGLALCLLLIFWRCISTQFAHGFKDAFEQASCVVTLLNLLLPPQLMICVSCRLGKESQRIILKARCMQICRWGFCCKWRS